MAPSTPLISVNLVAAVTVDGLTGSVNSILINGDRFTPRIVLSNGIALIEMLFTAIGFGAGGVGAGVFSFLQEKRKINVNNRQVIFLKFLFTNALFDHISINRMW